MINYDGTRLVNLFNTRHADLGNWRLRWNDISFYILPSQRSGFTTTLTPGTDVSSKIWDSTAMEANDRLANRIHEALTNPQTEWFALKFKSQEMQDDDAANEWLEDCADKLRTAIRDSNFDSVMGQAYLDLGAFGNCGVDVEEAEAEYDDDADDDSFQGFMFRSLHLGSLALAESRKGVIDQIFEKMELTAEQWVQRFEERTPQDIREAYAVDPDKKFLAYRCRFKRTLADDEKKGRTKRPEGPQPADKRAWADVWICDHNKQIVEDGGTYEQSAFIGRWRKKSDDIMGYGPGERALPTVRSVNEAERLAMMAWAKRIDPPIKTVSNNVIGSTNLASGGITVVRKMDESQAWDFRTDVNANQIELADKRYQIRDIFKYHQLELPAREQVGQMTAYEIAKRVDQVYRSLGPVVVQLTADLLNGIIARTFGIMYRKKAFLPLPASVTESKLEVEYIGPMAQAAKQVEIEALDRFIGDALALKNSGVEDAMDLIDMDKAMMHKAKRLGVPAKVLRSETELEEVRDERNKAKERAVDEQSALMATEAAKNIGQAANSQQMQGAIARMVPNAAAA